MIIWMNNRIHLENLDSANKFIRTELFNNNNLMIWLAFMIQSYDEFNDEIFYKDMLMVSINNFSHLSFFKSIKFISIVF